MAHLTQVLWRGLDVQCEGITGQMAQLLNEAILIPKVEAVVAAPILNECPL